VEAAVAFGGQSQLSSKPVDRRGSTNTDSAQKTAITMPIPIISCLLIVCSNEGASIGGLFHIKPTVGCQLVADTVEKVVEIIGES
jgi:hypothetical protein